ncbi:MAG TPA: HEAT repeat domain-containing protein, partial [Candidatus Obscuribacterales bacterium]
MKSRIRFIYPLKPFIPFLLASGLSCAPALAASPPWSQPQSQPSASPTSMPTAAPSGSPSAPPTPTSSALPPGSCAELAELPARLDCLKTRIQRQEAGLVPDVMAFLAASPHLADPPLAWLQALSQPELLKQLVPFLKGQSNPVLRQHLLLLFQYVLTSAPGQLDAITRSQLFDNVRDLLNHPHVPTRLQALDLWLSHRQAESLPQLKQALASPVAPERVLALVHYQRMQAEPALKKNLPGIPAAEFLRWTQQSDQSIAALRTWTFHPLFRSGEAPPATLHAFLGQWLDAGPTDMVKLGENSLLLLLKHEHPAVRAFALGRLAKTGNPAYGPRLEALFEDPDPAVRLRAHDALDLLQKLVPLQYLESLKDAKALPPDTPNRIRSLMRNPETRSKLLEPPYRHLARQPVFLEELWNLLQTSTEPELLFKGLQMLRAAPSNWPLTRLQPLLEPSQDVRVRTSALAAALQRPYSPEL